MDYGTEYDAYWERPDRRGRSSGDLAAVADMLMQTCGLGRVLDVGSGEGALVRELLARGLDAHGLDVSAVVVERAGGHLPGRFRQGSVLSLPFPDGAFPTVVSTDCLEHIAPEDVPAALAELYRVSARFVVLQVATTVDRDARWHLTVQGRAWWERLCFEAGFRKHPGYYRVNAYEALQDDGRQILIPLEKMPAEALRIYPLDALTAERDLHMDMLRDTGERSDAHVVRYQWACDYVRPGDRVLDAACGLGYGSHVVRSLTRADGVIGVDASEYAVDYARHAYGGDGVSFQAGLLPEVLDGFPEGSFDAVISFETLEHVADPDAVLAAFHRVLTPGGRVIVGVPNDWSDESGEDPNPYHLQVYDWDRLRAQLRRRFVLEDAFQQDASQSKIAAAGGRWERRPRRLRRIPLGLDARPDSEWWLMVGMRSPLEEEAPRPADAAPALPLPRQRHAVRPESRHPGAYAALFHVGFRLRDAGALEALSRDIAAREPAGSSDHRAALATLAYLLLQDPELGHERVAALLSEIGAALEPTDSGPFDVRWRVSLLFVRGRLLQAVGRFEEAVDAFSACAGIDPLRFSVHLATKTTDALFRAGMLCHALGRAEEGTSHWRRAVAFGERLLSVSLADVVIDPDQPNLFDYGDGVREYALAWDNVARAANGLHLLATEGAVRPLMVPLLLNSFGEGVRMARDALDRAREDARAIRDDLSRTRQDLAGRGALAEMLTGELEERTGELVSTREELVGRSAQAEALLAQLEERTGELVSTREELVGRSAQAEALLHDLGEARAK